MNFEKVIISKEKKADPFEGCRGECRNGHGDGCPGTVLRVLRTETPCHYNICAGKKCLCKITCDTPCGGQCLCAHSL